MEEVSQTLQRSANDVLDASKPLIGRLHPLAATLIQSETRLLSCDVLLLSHATSGKRKSLQVRTRVKASPEPSSAAVSQSLLNLCLCIQEDLKEQKLFHTCLKTLEKTESENKR